MYQNRKGFTLIELLVVIAIIAILAAILFPIFITAKQSALRTQCASNLKQCTAAWQMYTDDYSRTPQYFNGYIPVPPYWHTLLPWWGTAEQKGILGKYLKSTQVAWCPAWQKSAGDWYNGRTYGYNGFYLVWGGTAYGWTGDVDDCRSRVTPSQIQQPSKTICLIDSLDGWADSPASGAVDSPHFFGDKDGTVLANRHNGGWNVSFCDGHVKWYSGKPIRNAITVSDYLWALDKSNYKVTTNFTIIKQQQD